MLRPPASSSLFPTRRSSDLIANIQVVDPAMVPTKPLGGRRLMNLLFGTASGVLLGLLVAFMREASDTRVRSREEVQVDRKSTRLNSSHEWISYAVFCLKKKT